MEFMVLVLLHYDGISNFNCIIYMVWRCSVMLKKIILGMLLIGSVTMAVKAPYWEAINCYELDGDIREYNETIIQLQRASQIETILNDNSNVVEIIEYCFLAKAQIVHMVSEHNDNLSLESLDKLSKDYHGLSMAIDMYSGNK